MITAQLEKTIPAFGKTITQISWRINYPDNMIYYTLQSAEGISLKDGNWIVPNEIIQSWGTDDSVISDALINAKPWEA